MKKLFVIPALIIGAIMVLPIFAACADVTEPAIPIERDLTRVQYIVCGNANFVSTAFHSNTGARDTIPAAMLPVLMEFQVPVGTEAFIRVHKENPDEIVTVLVIANGFINAQDTALDGDTTAEAMAIVW